MSVYLCIKIKVFSQRRQTAPGFCLLFPPYQISLFLLLPLHPTNAVFLLLIDDWLRLSCPRLLKLCGHRELNWFVTLIHVSVDMCGTYEGTTSPPPHHHPHHVMMDMNKATIEKGYAVMTWGHETRAQRQKAQTISLWIIHLISPLILPDIFLLTFLSLITSSSLHKDAQHRVSGERTQGELRVVTQARVSKHGRLIRDRLGVIMVNEWPYVTPSALSSVSVCSVHRDVNLGSFSTFAEFIRLVRKLQEETSKLTLKNLVHHSVSRQKWCIQAQTESASWRPVGWIKLKRPNICDCFPCTGCGELLQNSVAFICPAARLIRLEGGQRGLMGCFLFPTCSQRCGFYPLSSLCYWTKSL